MKRFLTDLVLGFLVLAAGAVLVGCAEKEATVRERAQYQEASRLYLAGRYAQSAQRSREVAVGSLNGDLRARASLLEGRSYLAMRHFLQAEGAFRRGLAGTFIRDEIRAGLLLGLADSLYGQERYIEAATQYLKGLNKYEGLIPADEATYKLAVASWRAGRWQEAREYFTRLLARYPESPRIREAKRWLASSEQAFSVQCGAFATKAFAQRLVEELKTKGFEPALVPITTSDGRKLTAVRVGSYRTWGEAARVRTRVQEAGFEARVVP